MTTLIFPQIVTVWLAQLFFFNLSVFSLLFDGKFYLAAVRSCLHRRSPRSRGFMANSLSAVCVIARDVVLQRPVQPWNYRVFFSLLKFAIKNTSSFSLVAFLPIWNQFLLTPEVYKLLTETSTPTAAMNSTLLGMCAKLNMLDTGEGGRAKGMGNLVFGFWRKYMHQIWTVNFLTWWNTSR